VSTKFNPIFCRCSRASRLALHQMLDTSIATPPRSVVPGFLSPDTVRALRAVLDPVFATHWVALAPDEQPQRTKIGGSGRGSGNAGILDVDAAAQHPELAQLCTRELLLRPELLDLAEALMGPCSLDSLQMSGLGTASRPELRLGVGTAGWHRDGVNTHSGGNWWHWDAPAAHPYIAPLGCNALVYLQDMTPDSGPLRV
jgi:hypothetical protein